MYRDCLATILNGFTWSNVPSVWADGLKLSTSEGNRMHLHQIRSAAYDQFVVMAVVCRGLSSVVPYWHKKGSNFHQSGSNDVCFNLLKQRQISVHVLRSMVWVLTTLLRPLAQFRPIRSQLHWIELLVTAMLKQKALGLCRVSFMINKRFARAARESLKPH